MQAWAKNLAAFSSVSAHQFHVDVDKADAHLDELVRCTVRSVQPDESIRRRRVPAG